MRRRVFDQLTEEERQQLREFTKPYGRLNYACQLSKVPLSSMKKLISDGTGIMENTKKVRSTILKDMDGGKLQTNLNNSNVAA